MRKTKLAAVAGLLLASSSPSAAATAAPTENTSRIERLLSSMTLDEKIRTVTGVYGAAVPIPDAKAPPPEARGGDGFVHGVPRLGIPDQNSIGAGLGVTNLGKRNQDSTALPSTLALASSFDVDLAHAYGAVLGDETHRQGFNIALGGGVDLQRDPRGGRAFEYQGEDPVLAGRIIGAILRGTQDQGVVATIKHFALNDIDNGRFGIDVHLGERAMRESELLAFEIGLRNSGAGAVMCSYNLVNTIYACENPYLLNEVLKRDWGFKGWVMSDWGGTHSTVAAANAGLDQEFYNERFFGDALKKAVISGQVPQGRLNDMVRRILTQLDRVGAIGRRDTVRPIDADRGAAIALRTAEDGSVLLRNNGLLPLDPASRGTVAVIGFNADRGVLSGGGSSQVDPIGGNAVPPSPEAGADPDKILFGEVWDPSPPLAAIRARAGVHRVLWDPGTDLERAAKIAASADTVIVFAGRHRREGADLPDLTLGDGQEALIAAVTAANPRTVVVLETGGAQVMPWLGKVGAVLETWYPGERGGEAIAKLLFGDVNPSGKLPLSFPQSVADLARPKSPGPPFALKAGGIDSVNPVRSRVDFAEGPLVGYKWFDAKGKAPLFPFGYGLSYTTFGYSGVEADLATEPEVSFEIANTGKRAGTEIAQVYVTVPGAGVPRRLAGWVRATLDPGAKQRVTAKLEPLALANWDVARHRWVMPAGTYQVTVGASSRDLRLKAQVEIAQDRILAATAVDAAQ